MALTAFGDPLYCEAIVTMHSYDIVLDIFIVNRTAGHTLCFAASPLLTLHLDTLANISLDLATVGDLRLVERLQPFSLPAHKSTTLRQSVKVSSTETGVIYGAITYDLASVRGGGLSPPDLRTVSINLADIHMDVMEYVFFHLLRFLHARTLISNVAQLHQACPLQRHRIQEDVERV